MGSRVSIRGLGRFKAGSLYCAPLGLGPFRAVYPGRCAGLARIGRLALGWLGSGVWPSARLHLRMLIGDKIGELPTAIDGHEAGAIAVVVGIDGKLGRGDHEIAFGQEVVIENGLDLGPCVDLVPILEYAVAFAVFTMSFVLLSRTR